MNFKKGGKITPISLIGTISPLIIINSCATVNKIVDQNPTTLKQSSGKFDKLGLNHDIESAYNTINTHGIFNKREQLLNGINYLINANQILDLDVTIDQTTLIVRFRLAAHTGVDKQGQLGSITSNWFSFVISGFINNSINKLVPTQLISDHFNYQALGLNQDLNKALSTINAQGVIDQKVNIFQGTISFLKDAKQVLKLTTVVKQKTIKIEIELEGGAGVDQSETVSQSVGRFNFEISGFIVNNPVLDGSVYLDPNVYPQLFNDKHLFNGNQVVAFNNVKTLLMNTPLFQASFSNLMGFLENYQYRGQIGVDFMANQFDSDLTKAFFKMIENIGFYGDFSKNDQLDVFKGTPQGFDNEFLLEQRQLDPISDNGLLVKIDQAVIDNVNQLVLANPFGFLATNLSQLLYYLDLTTIGKIFNLTNVQAISADTDDQSGLVKILIESDAGKQIYQFDPTVLVNLKTNHDFKQYLFEHSFMISAKLGKYVPRGINGSGGYQFKPTEQSGSAGIVDRIINEQLAKKDQYQFLVATNLHVANLAPYFERNQNVTNKYYHQYWNAGFVNQEVNGGMILDKIQNHQVGNRTYDELIKSQKQIATIRFGYFEERDFEKIEADYGSGIEYKKGTNSIDLNESNYLDLVGYTPNFQADNVRSQTIGQSEYFFGKNNYDETNRIGKIHNAGADLALLKITLTKEQIAKMFPSLFKVLESDQESLWYPGLGNNQDVSAANTVFSGGFPLSNGKTIKSIGGVVKTRHREVSIEQNTQSYGKAYNADENAFMNQYNFRKDGYVNKQRPELAHGMRIEHVLQDSILHIKTSDGKYQNGGASGSLAINSRFEPIGVMFNKIIAPNGNPNDPETPGITNSISLFKHQSRFQDGDGSILNDVVKKLSAQGLKTVKLKP